MSTALDFRYLSEPDMIAAGVTDIARCIEVMEETLILLRQGNYAMAGASHDSHGAMITFPKAPAFPGMPADGPDRRFMAMPAFLGGRFGTTGVKWYGSNVENKTKNLPRSIHLFTLNDTETGAPLAVMSANLLSAYRTGAVPGLGVKHFARDDASSIGLIGPGVMGRTIVEAALSQRPSIERIAVKGRSTAGIERFSAYIRQRFPQITRIEAVDTIEDAVRGSDVIIAATTTDAAGSSAFPYIRRRWIKPGAVLLLPAAARFDDDFVIEEARTVLDARGLYDAWYQEMGRGAYQALGIPGTRFYELMKEGRLPEWKLEQIADVATGKAPRHRDEDEIVLYSVGGMPVEDVAWATDVYRRAVQHDIGTTLPLWETPVLA